MKKKKVAKKFAKTPEMGALVKECVLTGYTFAKTRAMVEKKFPNTEFSKHCYYWYYWYRRHTKVGKIVGLVVAS